MIKFAKRRKGITALVALVVVGASAIGAYAFWSASGSGNANATASSAQAITVTAGTAGAADLYPNGPAGTLYFQLSNPNPYPVSITSVTGTTITSSDEVNCLGATYMSLNGSPWTTSFALTAHESNVQESIPSAIKMLSTAPDGCQGKTFTVALTVSGAQTG